MSLPTPTENQQPQSREVNAITAGIEKSVSERRVPRIMQGLYDLVVLGDPQVIRQIPPVEDVLRIINGDELLKIDLMGEVIGTLHQHELRKDGDSIRRLVNVAGLITVDHPQVQSYLNRLKEEYPPNPNPIPHRKQPGRIVSRRSLASGLAAGVVGGLLVRQIPPTDLSIGVSVVSSNQELPGSAEPTPSSTATKPADTRIPATKTSEPPTATLEPPTGTATKPATATKPVPPSPSASATKPPIVTITETPKPPTATKTSTPSPTPDTTQERLKKEIDQANIAEYLMGKMIEDFKNKRWERWHDTTPAGQAFRERMMGEEVIGSNWVQFLYLGIDETRERLSEANDQGIGRADVIKLISFDPKTGATRTISFPRDLFVPEMGSIPGINSRINATTMIPKLGGRYKDFDTNEYFRKIIETATGRPVDAIFKTNIDFMQGFDNNGEDHPGFLAYLFPNGLTVNVTKRIDDPKYPISNLAWKHLVIERGSHIFNAQQLTEYARSRYGYTDHDRSERQTQILYTGAVQLAKDFGKDLLSGTTVVLDRIIGGLEAQQQDSNMYTDIDMVGYLKKMREGMQDANGGSLWQRAKMLQLAKNSASFLGTMVSGQLYKSFGMSENRMLDSAGMAQDPYLLKVAGSNPWSRPTTLGNYLDYWKPLRDILEQRFFK